MFMAKTVLIARSTSFEYSFSYFSLKINDLSVNYISCDSL